VLGFRHHSKLDEGLSFDEMGSRIERIECEPVIAESESVGSSARLKIVRRESSEKRRLRLSGKSLLERLDVFLNDVGH
jgi:hypothetical protein